MTNILTSPPFLAAIAYLLFLPIVLYGFGRIQKWARIDRPASKIKNRADLEKLPRPAWGVWVQRIKFTLADKRSVTLGKKSVNIERRIMLISLYVLGLVLTVGGTFVGVIPLILLGVSLFFVSAIFGIKSSKSLMSERNGIMERMLSIGKSRLGLPPDAIAGVDVKVLEWEDFVSPQKVEYSVPTTFSDTGTTAFLLQFNQVFGQTQEWVASAADGGWDFEKGVVTLAAVPPLPTMAPWSEHYVLAEGIADSFFPVGVSVQGGVELKNPETGKVENVIGFDVGGKQVKEGKKAGLVVNLPDSASPQLLIAGATGSGKALSTDTLIATYVPMD